VADIRTNLLYFGDNLGWLQQYGAFPDQSIDLVYLDPPFNSNRNYNVLFKETDVRDSEAQIHAFEDTWSWSDDVQDVYNTFWAQAPEKPKQMLKAMIAALGRNDVTAYLTMMAPRLVELHRVLKPTGSLYLHCDPTASHYLKSLLDSIFGVQNFVNEIVWKRSDAHSDARQGARHFGRVHDVLLLYAKRQGKNTFNPIYSPLPQTTVDNWYRNIEPETGRRFNKADVTGPGGASKGNPHYEWNGITRYWRYNKEKMQSLHDQGRIVYSRSGMPYEKRYLDESKGVSVQDLWSDIEMLRGISTNGERLGYPTQKPLALLERVITTSSNPGDIVLDPFCGCGTAVHAAHKLGRRWIGIDITPLATNLIRNRLQDAFPGLTVPIQGWPEDMAGAIELAAQADKYHFQDWAVIQSGGRPAGGERKKGADKGIDGVIPFMDGNTPRRGIISVKSSANPGPTAVRDLSGVLTADPDAAFGVFICLNKPTPAMTEAALDAGTWVSDYDTQIYPRIQILSAQDLIDGKRPRMPASSTPLFAQPKRERPREGIQGRLG
jgi:DNA modification methylase